MYPKYKRKEKLSAKLSEDDLRHCRTLRKVGYSYLKLASLYNVHPSTMQVALMSKKDKKIFYKNVYNRYLKGKKKKPELRKRCKERKMERQGKEFKEYNKNWFKNKSTKI